METSKNITLEQRNFNLAVNFMVIENVVKLMDVYGRICDEHEFIATVFELAKKFQLGDELHNHLQAKDEKYLSSYLQIMSTVFGLDPDIVFGYRQIDLGIGIDPQLKTIHELGYYTLEELRNWLQDHEIENIPWYTQYDVTDVVQQKHSIYELETEEVIDRTINHGIGNLVYTNDLGAMQQLLGGLSVNPLGINNLGVFIGLYIKHYRNAEKQANLDMENALDDIFEAVFNPINIVERDLGIHIQPEDIHNAKDALRAERSRYVLQPFLSNTYGHWNENVYSLKSLIINLLINSAYDYKEEFEKQETKVDSASKKQNPTNELQNELDGMKPMDKYVYLLEDSKERCLPYPLKLEENSELLVLIRNMYQSGYHNGVPLVELIYISTIQEEIDYYRSKQYRIEQELMGIFERDSQNTEDGVNWSEKDHDVMERYVWITQKYIPSLEKSQREYDQDPVQWAKNQRAKLLKQLKVIEKNIQNINTAYNDVNDLEILQIKSKLFQMRIRKSTIESLVKRFEKMLKNSQKNNKVKAIKPLLVVREPHYKEESLREYNGGQKRKSNKEKKYKNQFPI